MEYGKKPQGQQIGGGAIININKIGYTFNVNYIDTEGTKIYDSYTGKTEGTKSTFSPEIVEVPDHCYAGYYYENETGEQGINSQGNLSSLLADADPVITPNSEGKDAENGQGVYTVYAVYNAVPIVSDEYTVIYDANGGEGNVADPNKYAKNDVVTVLDGTQLSRNGYIFTGWNTDIGGKGNSYAKGDTFTITENTTLYAQWQKVAYTVTYDANGGTGKVADPNNYAVNDVVTVLSGKGLSKDGSTFSGWNTAADGSGVSYVAGSTFTITGNVILYAQWEKKGAVAPTPAAPTSAASHVKTTAVKTGDGSFLWGYALVMALTGIIIYINLYLRRKKKEKN